MEFKSLFAAACGAALLTGCVTPFTGAVGPGDELSDQENRPVVEKAAADFARRQNFRRPVIIKEDVTLAQFLGDGYVPRSTNLQVNRLCANSEVRRMVVLGARTKLREIVNGLRDLELVTEAEQNGVSVTVGEVVSKIYQLTYNVSNIDMQLRETQSLFDKNTIIRQWVANATVEVRMSKPNGDNVFTFSATGTSSQEDDGSLSPNPTMLEQAAINAIDRAMNQYAIKFGPPMYVVETCQDGQFAKINVGTEYGIREGMTIEFYRQRVKPGLNGQTTTTPLRVGLGTVGKPDAPLTEKEAWVYVEDYDPEARSVFQWTSARPINYEKSTLGLGSLDLSGFGL